MCSKVRVLGNLLSSASLAVGPLHFQLLHLLGDPWVLAFLFAEVLESLLAQGGELCRASKLLGDPLPFACSMAGILRLQPLRL